MKKRINEKKKTVLNTIKFAKYMTILGLAYVIIAPFVSKDKDASELSDGTILYHEQVSYKIEDIANAKLYYATENNYIEITSLDIDNMKNDDYVLELYVEDDILRYDVNEITYENDEFFVNASHEGISQNQNTEVIDLRLSEIDMENKISVMSNFEEVSVMNVGGVLTVNSYEEFISAITNDLNANIVIASDLDFKGYVTSDYVVPGIFTGTIDGNNHVILNLSNTMFEKTDGASISNLMIKDAFVSGAVRSLLVSTMENTEVNNVHIVDSILRASANNGCGPFAGTVTSSNLSNISVTDTIVAGARFLGGLFGLSYGETNVENAYVGTEIRNYDTYAAGVVTLGYTGSSINISNSVVDVILETSADLYKGGIYGEKASGTLNGVVVNLTTDVERINKIGETALYAGAVKSEGAGIYTVAESGGTSSGFGFEQEVSKSDLNKAFYEGIGLEETYWNLENINSGIPTLKSYEEVVVEYKNNEEEIIYTDVATAAELIEVISNNPSVNINITDDLNFLLYDTSRSAIITDTYSGILKGNGHAILNLSIPLFNQVDEAEIYDLLINEANISGRVGIFSGTVSNSIIKGVHIKDSYLYSTNSSSGVGALAGAITSCIIDDYSLTNSTVNATKRSGGLSGYSYGTTFLSNIYIDSRTSITNNSDATGGLIGQSSAYIHLEDAIIAPVFNSNGSSNRGGIIGYSTGIVQFVDVVVSATSTSADSIANNIPIIHGYSASTVGNIYEWEESNLKKQYDYAYSSLLANDDITYDFFVNTLNFDEDIWDISKNTTAISLPVPASLNEMVDRYEEGLPEIPSSLKTVSQYDALIKQKYSVNANQELTEEVEHLALLRNLVNNVGYDHLVAYYRYGDKQQEFIEWLVEYENVKMYTEAGEPDGGSYIASIRVLYEIYEKYSDDLKNNADTGKGVTYSEMYSKMMFSISRTHATIVGLWVSKSTIDPNEPNNSTGIGRYEIYKRMMLADLEVDGYAPETAIKASILDDIFYTLEMEEMRYVMNGIIDDESVEWMEWYVRTKNNDDRGGYALLSYTFGYNYVDEKYYTDEEYWDNIYGFKQFGMTYSQSYPKQWSVFEEGGVCGAISKSATNAQTSNGRPGTVVSQPGHAAYVYLNTAANGDHYWGSVHTNISGWAYTGKTEKLNTRMPNGWGNDSSVTGYAASYLFISQAALNDYDNYVASEMELLLAQVYAGDTDKQETIYWNALDKLDINLDAWLALARLYVADETKTDYDKYDLLEKMADALTYQPLPLYHVSNIVIPTITDKTVQLKISNLFEETFTTATKATGNESLEASGVILVAEYLLGVVDTTVATFSFNGDNAGKVVLNSSYEGVETIWYVSIDGGSTWIDAEGVDMQLTEAQLGEINEEDDIRINFSGSDRDNPENHYIIDITQAAAPIFSANMVGTNLYANDWENRVIGGDLMDINTIQWYDDSTKTWKWIEEERPDLSGDVSVTVRVGPSGTNTASASTIGDFTIDTDVDTRKYVSIDRLSIADSSSLWSTSYAYQAIDGSMNTMFHSAAQADNYIIIEVEEPIYMTAYEYTPRTSGSNGIVYTGEIYTSLDNENWTHVRTVSWANNSTTKVETFEEDVYGKYIKLVATSSGGNYLSAAMINLFEDTSKQETVELVYSNTQDTNKDVTVTLVSDDITITNNNGENTYTFTENGEFTFEYTNNVSTEKMITAKVTNIDKEAPTADVNYVSENGTIVASLINISEEITVSNNDGQKEYSFYENGEFTFEIEDSVGNTNSIKAIVENISYAYIQIGDEVYGDSKTFTIENPIELPDVEYGEDEEMTKEEKLVDDIEVYENNQKVDLEIEVKSISTYSMSETYFIQVNKTNGFNTYYTRSIVSSDTSDEEEQEQDEEVNKDELQKKIEEAKEIDLDGYSDQTVSFLKDAIEKAEKVFEDENATKEDFALAIEYLEESMANLKMPSSDNELTKMEIVGYEITPEFDSECYEYFVTVGDIKSFNDIDIETSDENAIYGISGNEEFVEGQNIVTIVVTAENKESKEYKITVTKVVEVPDYDDGDETISDEARLEDLEFIGYSLSPEFSSDVYEYEITVEDLVGFGKISIKTKDTGASYVVKGNGNFIEGENIVTIEVMAADEKTIKSYTIKVNNIYKEVIPTSISLQKVEVVNGEKLIISGIIRDINAKLVTEGYVEVEIYSQDGNKYGAEEFECVEGEFEATISVEKNHKYIIYLTYYSEEGIYSSSEINGIIDTSVDGDTDLEEDLDEENPEEQEDENNGEQNEEDYEGEKVPESLPNLDTDDSEDSLYPFPLPNTGHTAVIGVMAVIISLIATNSYKKSKFKKTSRRKR